MLFQLLPISIHANVIVCLLLAAFLWKHSDRSNLILWVSLVLFITIARDITYFFYKRDSNRNYKLYYLINYVEMAVSSLIWGFSGFLIFTDYLQDNTLIIVTILGIILGGTISLSSDKKSMFPFIALVQVPFIIRMFLLGKTYYNMIGIFLIVFYILINLIAQRINKLVVSNLDFKETNKEMVEELRAGEKRYRTIFENAPAGIFYYDRDLKIYDCNESYCTIFNTPRENLINRSMKNLNDKRLLPALMEPFNGTTGEYEGEYTATISGQSYWIALKCSPLEEENGEIRTAVGILQDRSTVHKIEEQMTHMAYHDSLTGLPNRLLLKDRINQALLYSARHNNYGSLIFLDLDDFKKINDSLGHTMGDALLVEVSRRITKLLRTEDTVSRLGGDEFVVVLPKLHDREETSMSAAGLVAEKIHQALSEPFQLNRKTLYTTTSIGIVLFSRRDGSIEKLLKDADTAMYEAKKEGRGKTHFYNIEMNQNMQKRLNLENHLRHAIQGGELVPYFQPIHQVGPDKISGAETLLRWNSPDLGFISPADFIPLAEETGLILQIGSWLIEECCRILSEWLKIPEFDLDYISINISVNQLQQKDFHKIVSDNLKRFNIPPRMLVLEITENVLIGNYDKVLKNIKLLNAEGIHFALDDFGTGYSSLTYLKKLKLNIIKIDRSFISDICHDRRDSTLVDAINRIAKSFNFKVIAEGVEEKEQINLLEEMGCRFLQGYYYSRPLPQAEFLDYVKSFKP